MTGDPVATFDGWFGEARAAGIALPEAMTLATATPDGAPSARVVLMKGHDADGFVAGADLEEAVLSLTRRPERA